MKKTVYCLILHILISGCTGPQDIAPSPSFPSRPSRPPDKGFHWEIVSGSGLKCWAQKNRTTCMIIDDSLPGARIVRNDDKSHCKIAIQIIPLPDKNITALLNAPQQIPGLDTSYSYIFREIPSERQGVRRYIPEPTRKNLRNSALLPTRIPYYFEVHENKPDKAICIQTGCDAFLFDAQSIVLTDDSLPEKTKDSLRSVQGILRIGHEVRTFTAAGDTTAYWVIDKTGQLMQAYEKATGNGIKNGKPVHAELKIKDIGKSDDGFASAYPSVYHIIEITKIDSINN